EHETVFLAEFAFPPAFGFFRQNVQPPGDERRGRLGLFGAAVNGRVEDAENGGLLDHLAVITAVQSVQDIANVPGFLDQRLQVAAGPLFAGGQFEHGLLDAGGNQIVFQRAFVLEVLLGLAAIDFVERRLRDVDVAAPDQLLHLPEEERQEQRTDMGAVHVRVRHDDDLVIAQLVRIEFVAANAGAERGDQRADFLAAEHLVETRALDVQDLAAQRQHRLEFAVASLLGGAAGGIALDDEQL